MDIGLMFEYPSQAGAPLRNRTVDLLLTMATASRPQRTSCTERTAERTKSTESTECSLHPVHDSVHAQPKHSTERVTVSSRIADTLSLDPPVSICGLARGIVKGAL
jgi:hypothetical protein